MIKEGGHAGVVPEDAREEEEEVVEPVDLIDVETSAKGKKTPSIKYPRWAELEDKCLCDAWKLTCIDLITGANQNSNTYWKMIKDKLDERKYFGVYAMVHSIVTSPPWSIVGATSSGLQPAPWQHITIVINRQESDTSMETNGRIQTCELFYFAFHIFTCFVCLFPCCFVCLLFEVEASSMDVLR
jgi:hypothetical protein